MIAAGIGCRAGCTPADIVRALEQALAASGLALPDVQALFSTERKASEAGLRAAANALERPLVFLPQPALAAQTSACMTRSARVLEHAGLPSVAEAAALAGAAVLGAGRAVRLLGARQVWGHATCALARSEGARP